MVANDGDWNTRVRWRSEDDAYVAELSWEVPLDATAGDYRISHIGYDKGGKSFSGVSDVIRIDE